MPPLYLLVPALGVFVGGTLPIVYLVLRALEVDPQTLPAVVFRARNFELLANTLSLAVGVLAFDLLVALPLAWLFSRTTFARSRGFALVGALPLAVPGYVMAYALLALGGSQGILSQLTGAVVPRLSGYAGALLALGLTTFPYLYLNLRAAFLKLDPALEEAARSLGHRPKAVFLRVVLPQLKPAFLAGALLVVLHVLGDFGVVSLMRYETFSYAIYLQYSASYDRVYAAWLALWLLVITGVLLFGEFQLLKNARAFPTEARPRRHAPGVRLRWSVPLAALFVGAVGLMGVGAPIASALYWLVRGKTASLTLPAVGEALLHSLSASLPAALLATLLALPLAYLGVRYASPLAQVLERVVYFSYATPPIAFALAFVFFSLRGVPFLYQTLWLLVLAYALHFLAEAIGPLRSSLHQTPLRLEEAARSLGHPPLSVFLRILLPLLRPGLVASAAFVFLSAMKELPLTFVLAPIGFETLATNAWSYTSEALFAEAAPYALAILAVSGLFVGFLLNTLEDTPRKPGHLARARTDREGGST